MSSYCYYILMFLKVTVDLTAWDVAAARCYLLERIYIYCSLIVLPFPSRNELGVLVGYEVNGDSVDGDDLGCTTTNERFRFHFHFHERLPDQHHLHAAAVFHLTWDIKPSEQAPK